MTNDATTHVSIDIFEKTLKLPTIKDPKQVIWVVDHNIPAELVETANVQKKTASFCGKAWI